jgi:uncharacterized protein GlcG (DUF336 family)
VLREVRRIDGAPLVSLQTAMSKAHAAAATGMPPDDFFAAIEPGAGGHGRTRGYGRHAVHPGIPGPSRILLREVLIRRVRSPG